MINNKEQILYIKDILRGVISIGGCCPVNCVFCSRKSMPNNDFVKYITLNELKDLISFTNRLNNNGVLEKDIWFGDGRILSDEPFTHPQFIEIFDYITNRFNQALIRMTTIGQYVKPEWYDKLLNANLSILVSANTFNLEKRKNIIHSPNKLDDLLDFMNKLESKISKVSIMYYGDLDILENDIKTLHSIHPEYKNKMVKLSIPDYSKNHNKEAKLLHEESLESWDQAQRVMESIHPNYVPIVRNLQEFAYGYFLNVWKDKFDQEFSRAIKNVGNNYDLKDVGFLLSESVYEYSAKYDVNRIKVINNEFGGSYCVSGLMTKPDIINAINNYKECLIYVVSKNMFSEYGEDIKGNHILDFGVKLIIE